MKRLLSLLVLACLLAGCSSPSTQPEQKQYNASFLDVFDTVTTIVGKADSEEAFRQKTQGIHDALQEYHRLFDIYNDYDGIANLKTINDNAGVAPVKVDPRIIALLKDCQSYYDLSRSMVNPAMGSVLQLWHVARNDGVNDPANAYLPKEEKLQQAAQYMNFDAVVLDEAASTVYITDAKVRLDVGAVAKGWSVQRVAENAPSGLLISVGGNVCATGPKDEKGTPWVIGIQDPDAADKNLHTVFVTENSVVTSGDYQRTYWVEGKPYHHIIDPDTLMPGAYWRSVSIVCPDSGLADALSTALFLLDREVGEALAAQCGAEVLWVAADGTEYMTEGFEKMLRT